MLRRLTAFYESHGISPVDFRCPSRSERAAGSPDFTEAKMISVPPRYGMRDLPRLLFLRWTPVAAVLIRENAQPKPFASGSSSAMSRRFRRTSTGIAPMS